MPNQTKQSFLKSLEQRYGKLRKLPDSLSMYEIGNSQAVVYIRYSKVHPRNQTFYGLRKEDLQRIEGKNAVICFLWNGQKEPLFIHYSELDDVFNSVVPASDGQYKVQIINQVDGTDIYVAQAGRFNVERFIGWQSLDALIDNQKLVKVPDLNHSQVQTLLGSIGFSKGYSIWIPSNDRNKLDWAIAKEFDCKDSLPERIGGISEIIREVDVIWMERGGSRLKAMFEVEHSTTIYSALLRFNDFFLTQPDEKLKFNIVADDFRRIHFLRQIQRPTFINSGLSRLCNFLEYRDVYGWYNRTLKG
jgi:hypothetical protein